MLYSISATLVLLATSAFAAQQLPLYPPHGGPPHGPPGRGGGGRGGGGGGGGGWPGWPGGGNKLDPVTPPTWNYPNRIVMIRHAEKPGRAGEGLSEIGKQRAQCLRSVFGAESEFDFGLVFAAPREASQADKERTWMTVAPLSEDLGLEVDILCANEPASCVRERVEAFAEHSSEDVLISWKHHDLLNIARALGVHTVDAYPDDRFDIMWIIEGQKIVEKRSEHCPGLDDGVVDL